MTPSIPSATTFLDPSMEEALFAGILQRKAEMVSADLIPHLAPGLFSTPTFGWLVGILKAEGPPSRVILAQRVADAFPPGDDQRKHWQILDRLYDVPVEDRAEVVDSFRRYIAFQSYAASTYSLFESFHRTRNVNLTLHEAQKGLATALSVLEGGKLQVHDYGAGWHERESQRKRLRENPAELPTLRLGVYKFDVQVKMVAGTVTNFLAPMKRYKSVILLSLAYAALLQGFNVVLVVLENTVDLTTNRLDSMFTQIQYDRVVHYLKTKEEKAYADEIMGRVASWPQRLKIIKGDPYTTSTADVRRILDRYEVEGFSPEVEIWDYLNIAKPSKLVLGAGGRPEPDNVQQAEICWDFQREANRPGKKSILITATQTNLEGAGKDKNGQYVRVDEKHQGRSIAIMQACNQTIGINLEAGRVEENVQQPPQIILSPLHMRDGAILYPDVKLISEIDRMCIDREQRQLWDDAREGIPQPPGDFP